MTMSGWRSAAVRPSRDRGSDEGSGAPRRAGRARALALATAAAALVVAAACGPRDTRPPALRQNSMTYSFVIRPDQAPPHASEDIHYTVQIFDRKTRQPIEHGEGQLFAGKPFDPDVPSGPQSKTWDGFAYGPEIGTYHAKLRFVVGGQWAVAIRFRRDSLHPLERIDWMQDVLAARPLVPDSTSGDSSSTP